MKLIENDQAKKFHMQGFVQQTLAGPEYGQKTFEVWLVTLSPGAVVPPYHHDSDVAWITLKGTGQAIVEGETVVLKPDTTLNIPPHISRQIHNNGPEDLMVLVIRGLVPVPKP